MTTLPVPTLVRTIIERGKLKFTDVNDEAYHVPNAVVQDDLL